MQTSRRNSFVTIRTEGGLLPADLLVRIAEGDHDVGGLDPGSYHLAKSERLNEAATRAWNRLQGAWEGFRTGMDKLPESDTGTTLTRERWLLILFQELGYGRLQTAKAVEIEGKSYPISHTWQSTPIHLVSFRQDLERRTPGTRGASRVSPHSLVQELLNRSDGYLWGFVSNGLRLRLLRDNVSLTRAACIEFDLQSMMEGEIYSDFVLLYLLCHQSRVEIPEGKTVEHCWLEQWYNTSLREGTRVLDRLRDGVEQAIEALGGGFLAHPANTVLRDKLRAGQLGTQDYYRQVLRIVYRLLFLFVAEDRGLLLLPADNDDQLPAARDLYTRYYSTQRLRRLAERRRSARHADLYRALRLIFTKLHSGCLELALPAVGSYLFSPAATPDLNDADITNADLLAAVWNLTFMTDGNVRRAVDYRNLGSEELGSVYESLLEMHPDIHLEAGRFELKVAAGSERKTTGSYYTPTSLVNCLLDSALEPVLDEACKKPAPEKALLDLKVCDPACGSGHFLIAAAHRIAKRLAAIRAGEDEPAPESIQHALRDVVGRCIYGADTNSMAVELCKINLWMEALEPGKPLSFLDHHIKCGDSLLGTTPALMKRGIPDEAFDPIEGDDKAICLELKKRNKDERRGQGFFVFEPLPWLRLGNLVQSFANLSDEDDSTQEALAAKEQHYIDLVRSAPYENAMLIADAWCAAFVCQKRFKAPLEITEATFRRWEDNPHHLSIEEREELERLRQQYSFFHWHLAFPEAFKPKPDDKIADDELTGWSGGFDCVLGNPPWERIKLQEKEFFAVRHPEIANAPNAAVRRRMIAQLPETDPLLYQAFQDALRRADGESRLIRDTGRYPLCGRGDVNTYTVFTELNRSLLSHRGRVGCIVPPGISTDDTTKHFFRDLMESRVLLSLYAFVNEAKLFPGIDHRNKYCLLTIAGSGTDNPEAEFAFGLHLPEQIQESCRCFRLSATDIDVLNPNTRTCPIFQSTQDAEITKAVYRRIPILELFQGAHSNPWQISFATMFHMANDSAQFITKEGLDPHDAERRGNVFVRGQTRCLPLYEGKMLWQFDHRFGTYDGQTEAQARAGKLPELDERQHANPYFLPEPRYWVDGAAVTGFSEKLGTHKFLIAFREVTNSVLFRTSVFSVLPVVAVGHKAPLLISSLPATTQSCLLACGNSFIFDYLARQKLGGVSMSYFVLRQLPAPAPRQFAGVCPWSESERLEFWTFVRVIELTYTAWDVEPFAQDCGWSGPPFRWDEERRFLIRCELDAALFHLYLGSEQEWKGTGSKELLASFPTARHAVAHIMETFPIVKRKDEQTHDCYRTKDTILEIYDEMAQVMQQNAAAQAAGRQPTACYRTRLDPPPGPPTAAAGNFIPMSQWDRAHWPAHIHLPKEERVPPAVVVPAEPSVQQIEEGLAVLHALALLHTWGKPVDRRAFELGMMLMPKDDLRERIVTRQRAAKPGAAAVAARVGNIDEFLGELAGSSTLQVENIKSRQLVRLGPKAPSRNSLLTNSCGKAALAKAQQVVQAVTILAEQGQSLHLYMEAKDHGTIEIAIS